MVVLRVVPVVLGVWLLLVLGIVEMFLGWL